MFVWFSDPLAVALHKNSTEGNSRWITIALSILPISSFDNSPINFTILFLSRVLI